MFSSITSSELSSSISIRSSLSYKVWEYLDNEKVCKIMEKYSNIKNGIDITKLKEISKNMKSNFSRTKELKELNLITNNQSIIKNYIYVYRQIKEDDDSFYRAIVFYFLEMIIFRKTDGQLKELTVLFHEKISSNNPIISKVKQFSEHLPQIKRDIVIMVMCIIIHNIENEINKSRSSIETPLKSHLIFLKAFFTIPEFEQGLIFFIKYLLYEHIFSDSDNNKILKIKSEDLAMELFAKKKKPDIFIKIMPLILNYDIYILDYNTSTREDYQSYKNNGYEINLLYKDGYFWAYYPEYIYKRYYNFFERENKEGAYNDKSSFKKNNKKPNNIDNNSVIIYKSDNNLAKCQTCQQVYKYVNVFSRCDNCLKLDLKNELLIVYFQYIDERNNNNYKSDFQNYFKKIISEKNYIYDPISQNTTNLYEAIKQSKLNFDKLFLEVRQNICLFCGTNIEDIFYIEFPCHSRICKKECFEKYIDNLDSFNKNYSKGENDIYCKVMIECTCGCGYLYKLKDFLFVYEKVEKLNDNKYIKIYQLLIKNNWKWLCMICRKKFNKDLKNYRLFLSDDKMDKNFLSKVELKHLICQKCFEKNKIIKNVRKSLHCEFCESSHQIVSIKKVDEFNSTESSCIIF